MRDTGPWTVLVMDLFTEGDGSTLAAMAFVLLMGSLPLLWAPDQTDWVRENPLTLGGIIILAGYARQRIGMRWLLFAVALILGAAHILISL